MPWEKEDSFAPPPVFILFFPPVVIPQLYTVCIIAYSFYNLSVLFLFWKGCFGGFLGFFLCSGGGFLGFVGMQK